MWLENSQSSQLFSYTDDREMQPVWEGNIVVGTIWEIIMSKLSKNNEIFPADSWKHWMAALIRIFLQIIQDQVKWRESLI